MKTLVVAAILLVGVTTSTPLWADARGPGPAARPAAPMVDGAHVEQHARMTEQMRVMHADPRMVDEMWSRMRDIPHVAAEEELQERLDRMLARR